MGKRIFCSVFLIVNCFHLFSQKTDTFHSVLYQAYISDSPQQADSIFELSNEWVTNDSNRAYQNYFKYYYYTRIQEKDSAQFYAQVAEEQLFKTKQYDQYFQIINNGFWDKVDESRYDEALQIGQANIEKALQLDDTVRWINFNANLAIVYHDIAQYEKGIQTAKKGLQFKHLEGIEYELSNCYNAIGICFDDWGKYDSAIYYHQLNLKMIDPQSPNLNQTLNNLGNTFFKKKELDSAYKYIWLAVERDQKDRRVYSLATSMNNLGNILLKQGKLNQAKFYLDSALHFSNLSLNNEKKRDVNHTLYEYYEARGDFKNAMRHLKDYHLYKDSMLSNERIKIINNLEFEAKEAKYAEKLAKTEAESSVKNFWLLFFGAILIISISVARQYFLKRKQALRESKLKLQNERLRISRDLHDNLGAELTYISSLVDQKAFDMEDPEQKAEFERISASSRHAMHQMRETIWAIKTDEISVKKFALKLLQTSKKYAESANAKLQVNTSGDDVILPPSFVIVLLRICQESINNAVKYSNADLIRIDFNIEAPQFTLTIHDNGQGFNPNEVSRGYGLNNMKERAEEIACSFEIKSDIGKGTIIKVSGNLP